MVIRPHSMTIIGWLAIGLGCLMMLSAAMVFLVSRSMLPVGTLPQDPALLLPVWALGHLHAVAVGETLVGLLAVGSGAAFLRLRAWSRVVLETMAWLALAGVLGFAFFWARTAIAITRHLPEDSAIHFPSTAFVITGIVTTLTLTVPIGVVISTLRGPTVRGALSRAGDPIDSVGL